MSRLKAAAGRLRVGGGCAGVVLCFANQQLCSVLLTSSRTTPAHPSAGGPTPLSCSSAVAACMRTPTPAAPAWQVTEQNQPAALRSRHSQHLPAAATWAPLLGGHSVIMPESLMWLLHLPACLPPASCSGHRLCGGGGPAGRHPQHPGAAGAAGVAWLLQPWLRLAAAGAPGLGWRALLPLRARS